MSNLLYECEGVRGRSMKVYDQKVVITTSVSIGSIFEGNATDGTKTIFYHDVVGIQFKPAGVTVGYLQFETPSGQMNNVDSNSSSENTFTFNGTKNGLTNRKMEKIYIEVCDLIEGIKNQRKLSFPSNQSEAKQESVGMERVLNINPNASEESLITRIHMFIEDEKWNQALGYANYILDMNPSNGYVYYLMLLINRKVKSDEELYCSGLSLRKDPNFKYIERYGSPELINRAVMIENKMSNDSSLIENNNIIYEQGIALMNKNQDRYLQEAIKKFAQIKEWRDSQEKIRECEEIIKNNSYNEAYELMEKDDIPSLAEAIKIFNKYPEYRNSQELITSCNERIKFLKNSIIDHSKTQIESSEPDEIKKGYDELVKLYEINNKYKLFDDDLIALIKEGKSKLTMIKMKSK